MSVANIIVEEQTKPKEEVDKIIEGTGTTFEQMKIEIVI